MEAEFGGISYGHHGHYAGLDGICDDEIGGVRDTASHIEADDEEALSADFSDGFFDVTAHEGAGENEGTGAGQAGDSADGVGKGLFTDKRDGID